MMRLGPVAAFVVTAVVMTIALGGFATWKIMEFRASDPEHFSEAPWPDLPLIFGACSIYVTGAGALVGLPLLALLHWAGLSRRWWALVLAGLAGGLLIVGASAFLSAGSWEWYLLEPALIVCGFGMAAGLMWWLLTGGGARAVVGEAG